MTTVLTHVVRFVLITVAVVLASGLTVFIIKELVPSDDDSSTTNTTGTRAVDSLKFVALVSRHGNRGAARNCDYPDDPYPLNDTHFWPNGPYELTTFGRTQMYQLGVTTRSLYNSFLPRWYNTTDIRSTSSGANHLLVSGESLLAGLYSLDSRQLWNKDNFWNPTTLYSDSKDHTLDIMSCKKYLTNFEANLAAFDDSYSDDTAKIMNDVYNSTGYNLTSNMLTLLWDKLISEDTEGYTLPSWVSQFYPEPILTMITSMHKALWAGDDETVQLLIGDFYAELLGTLQSVANGSLTNRKMNYYSGHDSSILALQSLLQVSEDQFVGMVRPGSGLILELHQNATSQPYTVKVLYLDGGLGPVELSLPTCGHPCYLDTLANYTAKFTDLPDWQTECDSVSSDVDLELIKRRIAKKYFSILLSDS